MRSRGFTLFEVLVGMFVIGLTTVTMVLIFQTAIVAYTRAMTADQYIYNARKGYSGEAATKGMTNDVRNAQVATSTNATSVDLTASDGTSVSYSLDTGGHLVNIRAGTSSTVAAGFSKLTTAYYARNSNYQIVSTTDPAQAIFVTFYAEMPASGGRTLYLYSGAKMRNR